MSEVSPLPRTVLVSNEMTQAKNGIDENVPPFGYVYN